MMSDSRERVVDACEDETLCALINDTRAQLEALERAEERQLAVTRESIAMRRELISECVRGCVDAL